MDIFDQNEKSQIDGKVIRKAMVSFYGDVVIVFTDKSYVSLPSIEHINHDKHLSHETLGSEKSRRVYSGKIVLEKCCGRLT
jgi:hypothetical protein